MRTQGLKEWSQINDIRSIDDVILTEDGVSQALDLCVKDLGGKLSSVDLNGKALKTCLLEEHYTHFHIIDFYLEITPVPFGFYEKTTHLGDNEETVTYQYLQ